MGKESEPVEVTQVISSVAGGRTATSPQTQTSQHTRNFSELIDSSTEPVSDMNLEADISLEFRRKLDKSGKRYKLLKVIAEGGFGRIFLAEDLVLGRLIVIKSLKEAHLARAESVRKFISEAKLTSQLDHPAIVPLYSLDTDSADGLHLAMQLINGITLKEYLKRERSLKPIFGRSYEHSIQARLESFLKVCDAIEYCHSRGIIHCDLKPENIMLGRHGAVYVMDWGIASPSGTCRKEHLDGTPAYMAPETLLDGTTNPQTDVFALGMILNELVTLRDPVTGADSREIIRKITAGQFEPSRPLNPKQRISPSLRAIIEKARAADPADRYSSAKELAADIRRYLFSEEVSARPDSLLQKFMRFAYRHRYATLLTMAAILCISAVMALYGARRQQNLASKVTLEMLRRLKVQLVTERLASQVGTRLLRIREQLNGLATSQIIEQNAPDSSEDRRPFYLASDFASDAVNRPPDLVRLPFYAREVSFGNAAYFKPDDMTRESLIPLVKQLRTSRRQGITLICDSMDSDGSRDFTPDSIFRRFRENGALLRRITYLMNDGTALRYPGMYETREEIRCSWLDQRRQKLESTLWSPPYQDSSGHIVISCWIPLLRPDGTESGLVGFELCYHKLILPILQRARAEEFKTTCFLVDSEGNLLFCSDDPEFRHTEEYHCTNNAVLKKRKFAHPEWIERFLSGHFPQFLARLDDGQLVRVSMSRIQEAGWILIRQVPPGTADVIDLDRDKRMRKNIEQDILLEEELLIQ